MLSLNYSNLHEATGKIRQRLKKSCGSIYEYFAKMDLYFEGNIQSSFLSLIFIATGSNWLLRWMGEYAPTPGYKSLTKTDPVNWIGMASLS